jgi:hypothetical protein
MHGLTSGVELGVADGRFTYYLLKNCPDLKMWAVDLWERGENEHESYADWPMEMYYEGFKVAVEEFGGRCKILKMDTTEALKHTPVSVDFAFVDADHSYNGVWNDIRNWSSKVDSFIAGHDLNLPGVQRAVGEFFVGNHGEGPDKTWIAWR